MSNAQHYKSNLRDIYFNLFEVLHIDERILGKGEFSGMDADVARATLEVRAGRSNELTRKQLVTIVGEATTTRGEPPLDPDDYRVIPFSLGLFPPLTINNIEKRRKVINRGAINLILGRAHKIHGVELSSGANWTLEDVRGAQLSAGTVVVPAGATYRVRIQRSDFTGGVGSPWSSSIEVAGIADGGSSGGGGSTAKKPASKPGVTIPF